MNFIYRLLDDHQVNGITCFLFFHQVVAREILTQFQVWQRACYSRNIEWGPITAKVQSSPFVLSDVMIDFDYQKWMKIKSCFQRVYCALLLHRSFLHCRSCMDGRQRWSYDVLRCYTTAGITFEGGQRLEFTGSKI